MQVRALTFRKQIHSGANQGNDWWITLGRLDEMKISELTPMALGDIKESNNQIFQKDSVDFYHYVIYLIDHDDPQGTHPNYGETSDSELWNEDLGFLSITRIHFPSTIDLDGQFKKLQAHFSNSEFKNSRISWRVYGTTELSDQVLVGRCRRFKDLSRWALKVTNSAQVGKAYTYFCIPRSYFNQNMHDWETSDDYIEHLSMRFAIKDHESAPKQLDEIAHLLFPENNSSPYRVSGNEDAIICGENIPIKQMILLYKTWYSDSLKILDVFSDIISRIGAKVIVSDNTKREPCALTEICIDLSHKITVCPYISGKLWERPLVELSNTLVHMSQSPMLDELVYLILPALYTFWENIQQQNLNSKDEFLYQQFVELCVHTMEHLMRAEGQLSQYPEVRPITYDIPVIALEAAIAFLQRLSIVLTSPDTGKKKKTSILLVPNADIDVSTVELFPATKHARGLLQITVPFSLLYDPKHLLLSLSHELAHYVGEQCRMRGKRYELYCNCLASEILSTFFEGNCNGNREDFFEYLSEEFLRFQMDKAASENGNDVLMQDEPLQCIAAAADGIVEELREVEAFAQMVRQYMNRGNPKVQFRCPTQAELINSVERFKKRNSDLRIVFREAYADICMLYCLKPQPCEYLDIMLPRDGEVNAYTCLRLLLSLCAAEHTKLDILSAINKTKRLDSKQKAVVQKLIEMLCQQFVHNEQKSFHSIFHLHKYIDGCWKKLNQSCTHPENSLVDTIQTLKDIYTKIGQEYGEFDYYKILLDIDQSRREMLEDFKA